ncbi:hypothetical protein DERF_007711 [Dermatophagoides farinae]|uniref:Uncharacterized protein n=1 Tax=Dermatophagoides farinae TaxID=6954 RepID=A0A922I000_DERFA|nr:hypothetical protein DERF_007711 [Dermatophagoides farinae]
MSTSVFDPNQPSTSQQHFEQSSSLSSSSSTMVKLMKPKLNLSNYRRQIRSRRIAAGKFNKTSNGKLRKWKKLNLRRCANNDEVDLHKVIYSCSYQYYSDDYLMRIHQVLSNDLDYHIGYHNIEQEISLPTHEQHIIDEFEINTFEDVHDFELYSKQQSLNYIEHMIEKRQHEKIQDQLAQVSYEEPNPDILHASFIDPSRVEMISKRKGRRGGNDQPESIARKNRLNRSSTGDNDSGDTSFYSEIFTRTSSRGRIIKPKNQDQWLLDMEELDALDEIMDAFNENNQRFDKVKSASEENENLLQSIEDQQPTKKSPSLPSSSQILSRPQVSDNQRSTPLAPAKVFSRLTPLGWKSFLICQNDPTLYEFNYVNLGHDRTVFIDKIRKIGENNESEKSKNQKCKKMSFSFSEVPFLHRLQQSDNEFRLYLSSTPMLLNMLNRDNEEKTRQFHEKAEKYINILGRFYEKHCERRMKNDAERNRNRRTILRRCIMNDVQEQYSFYSDKPFDEVWNTYPRLEVQNKLQPIHTANKSIPITPKSAFPKPITVTSSSLPNPISVNTTISKPITVTPSMTAKLNSNGRIQWYRKEIPPIKLTTHPNRSSAGTGAAAAAISAQVQKNGNNMNRPVVCKIPNNVGFKLHQASVDLNKKTIQIVPSNIFTTTTTTVTSTQSTTSNAKPISATSKPIIFRVQPSASSVINQIVQQKRLAEDQQQQQQQQQPPLKKIKTEIDDDDEITIVHEHIPKKPIKLIQVQRKIKKQSITPNSVINDEKKIISIVKRFPPKKQRIVSKVLLVCAFAAFIKSKNNKNFNLSNGVNNAKFSDQKRQNCMKNFIDNMDLD